MNKISIDQMPKKKQTTRLTQVYSKEKLAQLDRICKKLTINRTAAIMQAISKLAEIEGV